MRIAKIVPLRRLPSDRSWFDYELPIGVEPELGSLVEISFGRQTLPGVVWSITDETPTTPVKTVGRILQSESTTTVWQRQALETISAWYFVSLGSLLISALPTFLKRKKDSNEEVEFHHSRPGGPIVPSRLERVWWYRDRPAILRDELSWLMKDENIRCICVPTIEDLQDFRQELGPDVSDVAYIHGQLTDREYRLLYMQILRGQIRKVIGTGRLFHLPFPEEPRFLLDQEEHPAHRQLEQHPRLDNRQTVLRLQPQAIVSTPAPSIAIMHIRHPNFQSFAGQRQLMPLGQPGSRDWLTPDAEELILRTISQGRSVLAIVPHHGFAQRLACRDCGWTLECAQCHQRVRLDNHHGVSATCRACGSTVNVPAQCPRCQSTRWALSGLGREQFIRTVQRRWPQIPVTSDDQPLLDQPSIVVGTYQSHRLRRRDQRIGPAIIISGDALLSYPDFAVSERAWAFLARLQADRPDQLVAVQSYDPDHLFWQRWRHGDERSWYTDELQQRSTLSLPPMADHWILYHPNASPHDIETLRTELTRLLPPTVGVSVLEGSPVRRWRRPSGRLLLQAPPGFTLRDALPWATVVPSPWQIDSAIRGWSE